MNGHPVTGSGALFLMQGAGEKRTEREEIRLFMKVFDAEK